MEKLIIKWLIRRLEKRLITETNEAECYAIGSLIPPLKHYIVEEKTILNPLYDGGRYKTNNGLCKMKGCKKPVSSDGYCYSHWDLIVGQL